MKPNASLRLLPALVLVFSTGCLTNTQTKTLQADIDEIQAQLLLLQREHATIRDQIVSQEQKIHQALTATDEDRLVSRADLFAQVDGFGREMEILGQKLEDTNFRLSSLSAEMQANRSAWDQTRGAEERTFPPGADARAGSPDGRARAPASATPGGSPVPIFTGGASPEEIFNTAYADYTKGNYPLAILGFQEYREKFPGSGFADDSLYWIGESYYSQGKYVDAVQAFGAVVRRYPEGDKVPSAHLKRGFAFLELNQTAQGVVQLNALIEDFPHSDEARLARERLRTLGLRDR